MEKKLWEQPWTTSQILNAASQLVTGDRAEQHGPKLENHSNIARLWSAYLEVEISPVQAAMMMALLKIARIKCGDFNSDDFVDGAAYIAISGELDGRQQISQQRCTGHAQCPEAPSLLARVNCPSDSSVQTS